MQVSGWPWDHACIFNVTCQEIKISCNISADVILVKPHKINNPPLKRRLDNITLVHRWVEGDLRNLMSPIFSLIPFSVELLEETKLNSWYVPVAVPVNLEWFEHVVANLFINDLQWRPSLLHSAKLAVACLYNMKTNQLIDEMKNGIITVIF